MTEVRERPINLDQMDHERPIQKPTLRMMSVSMLLKGACHERIFHV